MFSNFRTRYIHRKTYRRRLIPYLALFGFVGIFGTAFLSATNSRTNLGSGEWHPDFPVGRKLLQQTTEVAETSPTATTDTSSTVASTTEKIPEKCIRNKSKGGGLFIPDIFSREELRHGALVLHFFGLIYMFVALAIVCDEFFVPALGVITEKAQISDDVAGATFMAAGGSAPEFFTSVIGVFIARDNVGIGTIVGSATFNILCVLAFCCLFSKGDLHLTWWPLFRDVAFYILALALVVIFFLDDFIIWWEALVLFIVYILYCAFMKFNEVLEVWVKTRILGHSVQVLATEQSSSIHNAQPPPEAQPPTGQVDYGTTYSERGSRPSTGAAAGGPRRRSSSGRRQSIPILHSGAMFRNGIVQLMVHTLDPLSELHVDEKLVQLHGMASVKVVLDRASFPPGCSQDGVNLKAIYHQNPSFTPDMPYPPVPGTPEDDEVFGQGPQQNRPSTVGTQNTSSTKVTSMPSLPEENESRSRQRKDTQETPLGDHPSDYGGSYQQNFTSGVQNGGFSDGKNFAPSNGAPPGHLPGKDAASVPEDEEIEEPLDISWPSTCRKQVTYIVLAPIVFPLWLTIPDVRKPESRRWYPISFVGSIAWIAIFSYLMVWWANTIGNALDVPTEIMGLTMLAAGTSIPDLITSVLVARKGLGDMAVSSSIGSNIFDVCVGLPIPWLLYFIINAIISTSYPISVQSKGLVCSVGMLFVMLIVLITAIGLFNWQMNKPFGIIMIFAYCVFCVISVLLEMDIVFCPLRVSECSKYRSRT